MSGPDNGTICHGHGRIRPRFCTSFDQIAISVAGIGDALCPNTNAHDEAYQEDDELHCLVPGINRVPLALPNLPSSIGGHVALLTRDNSLVPAVVDTRPARTPCNSRPIASLPGKRRRTLRARRPRKQCGCGRKVFAVSGLHFSTSFSPALALTSWDSRAARSKRKSL